VLADTRETTDIKHAKCENVRFHVCHVVDNRAICHSQKRHTSFQPSLRQSANFLKSAPVCLLRLVSLRPSPSGSMLKSRPEARKLSLSALPTHPTHPQLYPPQVLMYWCVLEADTIARRPACLLACLLLGWRSRIHQLIMEDSKMTSLCSGLAPTRLSQTSRRGAAARPTIDWAY